MELHSHTAAKKLWNYLRVAFFMMRKGFASKRKLLMDMNLLMKRGNKLLTKSLAILMFHHHHLRGAPEIPAFGRREYEFSCSNSPNPVFYHGSRAQQRRRHHYFPCLHAVVEDDNAAAVVLPPRIAYSSSSSPRCFSLLQYSQDLAPGEQSTPPSTASSSLISLPSVWNYSSGDDETDDDDELSGREVDDEAEEFIKRFYEQLRAQSRIALLQYQELEYQPQMLIRGE